MNVDNRMYLKDGRVYFGTREMPVKDQRGKQYVNYKGRQVNVKDIPRLPATEPQPDHVFNYIFVNSNKFPCPAMDYWITRHRQRHRITVAEYKKKHNIIQPSQQHS